MADDAISTDSRLFDEYLKKITRNDNECSNCTSPGLYVETPAGADYITCPFCCHEYACNEMHNPQGEWNKAFERPPGELSDICDGIYWCKGCKMAFDFGHTHASNGCTDDIRNAIVYFRGKWRCTCDYCVKGVKTKCPSAFYSDNKYYVGYEEYYAAGGE